MRLLLTVLLALVAFGVIAQPNARFCPPLNGGMARLVVPFPAGSPVDAVARTMEHVVIDNRPGAGGVMGAELVARAKPDGQVLLLTSVSGMVFPDFLYSNAKFNPEKDFVAVSAIADIPMVVVANPSRPQKTLQDLLKAAKEQPGKINLAVAGRGTFDDMAAHLLASASGTRFAHIPFKGSLPAATEVMAGSVDAGILPLGAVRGQIQAGKLRPLAVAGAKKLEALPEVPTAQQAGLKDFEVSNWLGLFAPAGTSADLLACYRSSSKQFYAKPDVLKRYRDLDLILPTVEPEAFPNYLKNEVARWARIAKQADIKPNQ